MSSRWRFCWALAALLAGPASGAEHDVVRRAVQAGEIKPLAEILKVVQSIHPGRVLDVDLEQDADGRRWYEIKLLHRDGHRVEIYVDAVSGAEIRQPRGVGADIVLMGTALRTALARYPGVALEAELAPGHGQRQVYHILLTQPDGRERTVLVDAVSGHILEVPVLDFDTAAGLQPLPALVEGVERRYRARATETELKRDRQGRLYYEIELQLDTGRGLEVNVDGRTGRILGEIDLR